MNLIALQTIKTSTLLLGLVALVAMAFSCKNSEGKENDIERIPTVQKFHGFFEKHHSSIGTFAGPGAGEYWYTQGIAHDRYMVSMGFKLTKGEPQIGQMKIQIQEFTKVEPDNDGGVWTELGEADYSLGYQNLVKANSLDDLLDMSKLEIVKDQPVENIEDRLEIF